MIFTQPNKRLFIPSDISSTILWLDGTDPNADGTLPANNSLQSTWKDKSRSGLIFTQATTGNQPQNKNAFSNNKNMMYFGNNASTYMDSTTTFTVGITTSVCLALQFPVLTSSRWILETLAGVEFYIRQNTSTIQAATWNGAADVGIISGSVTANTTFIMSYVFNSTSSAMYINGALVGTNSYGSTSPNTLATHRIGNGGTLSSPYNGYIGDMIIANTGWSTADRKIMELYLATKWGISV